MSSLEQRLTTALAAEADSWPDPDAVSPPPGRRWNGRLVVAVAVVLALGSVAATWLFVRDVTEPTVVACHREASLDSDIVGLGSAGALEVARCAPEWASGVLVNSAVVPEGQVPSLVGCVTDQGVLAVFPSDDQGLCESLGLAVPDESSLAEGEKVRRLTDDLVDHFLAQDCQPLGAAAADVRKILDSRGFEDWEVRFGAARPDSPCASFGIDTPEKTIHLVGIPRLD